MAIFAIGVAPIVLLIGGVAFVALTANGPVGVPQLTGMSLPAATGQLEAAGLKLGTVTRRSSPGPANVVLDQAPVKSTQVEEGTSVDVVVSESTPASS